MLLKTKVSLISSIGASALLFSPVFATAQTVAAPALNLSINKTSMVATANPSYNDLPSISWTSTNATSCQAFGTGWGGQVSLAGSQKVNPSVTTVYSMTCSGAGGSIIKNVTLLVTPSSITNSQSASALGAYNQIMANEQSVNTTSTETAKGFKYTWTHTLQKGSPYADDVSALQMALTFEGAYAGEITGGFYNKTLAAVKSFQTKYGIEALGIVGPQTRAKLNALYGN